MIQSLQVLRVAAAAMIGLAVGALAYGVAMAPTRVPSRLGLRGLKRQKALQNVQGWSTVEPFVRWLGMRLGRVLSDAQRKSIDDRIMWAGDFMGITPDEYVALSLIGGVVGTLVGIGGAIFAEFPPGALGMAGGAYGLAALYMHLQTAALERVKTISRTLPYAVDLMALAMSAGLDFPASARQVVETTSAPDDPLVEEFTLILQAFSLGRTRKDALLEFSTRVPAEAVQEFVNSVVQAEERGNPVAEVLSIQAGVSRTRRSIRAEEAAANAAARLVLPLVMVMMVVLIMLLAPAMIAILDAL
jgi:tight adherence protein C